MKKVSKYEFKTPMFERAVIPGSAHGNDEPGCPGTIDFIPEPKRDKDRGNKLERWLDKNTTIPSQAVMVREEEGNCYTYLDGKVACSVTIIYSSSRDNHSAIDSLKYQKTAFVKVQNGPMPEVIRHALQRHGYKSVQ